MVFGFFKTAEKLHNFKLALIEIAKEVDALKEKLAAPAVKKKIIERSEPEETPEEKPSGPKKYNDGFDEIRAMQKP